MQPVGRADDHRSGTRPFDLDRAAWAVCAYIAVATPVCFLRLGSFGLVQMEGMVANGGRHMLATGEWWVPRVYGEIYTYKPALAYWLAAIAHRLSDPPPEWLLRLPFAGAVFVMGLAVLLLCARLVGYRVASVSAIATISGGVVIEKVRLAEFDGLVTAGVGIAIVAACVNLSARQPRLGIWVLGYLGLAAGFLGKGAPALMVFAPGLVVGAWVTGRPERLLDRRHVAAALLFVAVAGGYLFAAYRAAGPIIFEQPLAESKLRALGWSWQPPQEPSERAAEPRLATSETAIASQPLAVVARSAAKPVLILAAFLPWSLLAPFALSRRGRRSVAAETDLLIRAAGAFTVMGILSFMLVPTHSMRYYMPLCTPVGILAGLSAAERIGLEAKRHQRLLIASAWLAVLCSVIAISGGFVLETPPVSTTARVALTVIGVLALALTALASRSRERDTLALLLCLSALMYLAIERLGRQTIKEDRRDLRALALELGPHLPANEPVWVLGPADVAGKSSSLLYYLDRSIVAFRPDGIRPPRSSICLLASDRVDELDDPPGFAFEEIARVEHVWRDFLLGRCSWQTDGGARPNSLGEDDPRPQARIRERLDWNRVDDDFDREMAARDSLPSVASRPEIARLHCCSTAP